MKYTFLILLALTIYSCSNKVIEDTEQASARKLFDDSFNYMSVTRNSYDSLGLLISEINYYPHKQGIYLDTSISKTKHEYDTKGNLIKSLRVSSNLSDSTLTTYVYNENQEKVKQVKVKLPSDTTEIITRSYYTSDNTTVTEVLKLKKDPFARHSTNLPYDTNKTVIQKKFIDSTLIERLLFSQEEKHKKLTNRTVYHYDLSNQIIKKTSFNSEGDSVNWRIYAYENSLLKRTDFFIRKGEIIVSSIYDSNGFIKWVINKNTSTNKSDTSFLSCDTSGNVLEMKWSSNK
jgi:hypothetical protein